MLGAALLPGGKRALVMNAAKAAGCNPVPIAAVVSLQKGDLLCRTRGRCWMPGSGSSS
jgi:hypothetical protein